MRTSGWYGVVLCGRSGYIRRGVQYLYFYGYEVLSAGFVCMNAHRGCVVAPRLLLGSQRTPADPAFLRAHKVTHVLCMAAELPVVPLKDSVHHRRISVAEPVTASAEVAEAIADAITWASVALDGGGVVLVYCRRGQNRSAAIVVGTLMRQNSLSFSDAMAMVCRAQRKACICSALQRLLCEGERGAASGAAGSSSATREAPLALSASLLDVNQLASLPREHGARAGAESGSSVSARLQREQCEAAGGRRPGLVGGKAKLKGRKRHRQQESSCVMTRELEPRAQPRPRQSQGS